MRACNASSGGFQNKDKSIHKLKKQCLSPSTNVSPPKKKSIAGKKWAFALFFNLPFGATYN